MHSPLARTPSWQIWGAYGLLFLIFVTTTYDHSKAWNNPNRGDQDLDLILGLKIRHFEDLSDGYHHPLLPALVAPFAEKTLIYFAKAKLVNVAIGALAFWMIAWVGLRLVGPAPTFLALIAIAPGLSNKSAEFTAEPLLLMLVVPPLGVSRPPPALVALLLAKVLLLIVTVPPLVMRPPPSPPELLATVLLLMLSEPKL